jgi:hypothetical protein
MRRMVIVATVFSAALSFAPTTLEAGAVKRLVPPPAAAPAGSVGALPWALMACPASIILSGIVANFKDNRQLTFWEAVTCGLLYWIPMAVPVQTVATKPHHKP